MELSYSFLLIMNFIFVLIFFLITVYYLFKLLNKFIKYLYTSFDDEEYENRNNTLNDNADDNILSSDYSSEYSSDYTDSEYSEENVPRNEINQREFKPDADTDDENYTYELHDII